MKIGNNATSECPRYNNTPIDPEKVHISNYNIKQSEISEDSHAEGFIIPPDIWQKVLEEVPF